MRVYLRILFNDGTDKQVVATAPEIVAWETRFDKSVGTLLKGFKATDLLFLSWHHEFRSKATEMGFDDWLNLVDLVELGEADPK